MQLVAARDESADQTVFQLLGLEIAKRVRTCSTRFRLDLRKELVKAGGAH
jgi:hypothetical protein